ncbi:hypothetical protein B0T16DRAFT_452090 [Cercophora newfieldiana]|uniref:Uncharacterized protein n=1 Tax=Cercophora newfieldiana TaxID=92897 RepID=A0AA39YQZ9_9PEZI|nr:hypothetical protein B0T16DRAFT_452090 [Cercophora newfieldiana]
MSGYDKGDKGKGNEIPSSQHQDDQAHGYDDYQEPEDHPHQRDRREHREHREPKDRKERKEGKDHKPRKEAKDPKRSKNRSKADKQHHDAPDPFYTRPPQQEAGSAVDDAGADPAAYQGNVRGESSGQVDQPHEAFYPSQANDPSTYPGHSNDGLGSPYFDNFSPTVSQYTQVPDDVDPHDTAQDPIYDTAAAPAPVAGEYYQSSANPADYQGVHRGRSGRRRASRSTEYDQLGGIPTVDQQHIPYEDPGSAGTIYPQDHGTDNYTDREPSYPAGYEYHPEVDDLNRSGYDNSYGGESSSAPHVSRSEVEDVQDQFGGLRVGAEGAPTAYGDNPEQTGHTGYYSQQPIQSQLGSEGPITLRMSYKKQKSKSVEGYVDPGTTFPIIGRDRIKAWGLESKVKQYEKKSRPKHGDIEIVGTITLRWWEGSVYGGKADFYVAKNPAHRLHVPLDFGPAGTTDDQEDDYN